MSAKHVDNHTFLTTAPESRAIITMAIPSIISMLTTSIYNIVDTWFVGQINTQATAAVGLVFPVMSIMQAVGFFFGQGSGTFISRALGARRTEEGRHMASTGFFSAISLGVLITLLCLVFLEPLSIALGSTPTILPYTKEFLGTIAFGAPFIIGSMVLNNQMRFQGNASKAMWGLLSGALANVTLIPIFIFRMGMGIRGAALGTVIGQMVGFFVLLLMSRKGENIRLKPANFSFDAYYFKEIFKGGTPSLTRQGLASASTLLLNIAAGEYGDAAIAGMSIIGRISFVVFAVILGIGQGFQPFCGFNYGAKLYDRVRRGYFFSLKASMAFLFFVCVLCFIFSEELVDLLRHDPDVVAVGAAAFRWQIVTYPIAGFITISNMCLQTSGRSLAANLLAAARNGIFFIPLILILPRIFGLLGVEICQTVADVFSLCLALPLMIRYFRSINGINQS